MKHLIISKNNLQPSVWNGGKTYEYYIYPPESNYSERNFLFRISAASIEKVPSHFTRFKNFNRFLVMLDNDLNIQKNGIEEHYSQQEIFTFASNDEIISYAKGNDFNLMIHQDIKEVKVFVLNNTICSKQSFQFLFAKEESQVKINQQQISLKVNDLLVIENKDKEEVELHSNNAIIVGFLTLKK